MIDLDDWWICEANGDLIQGPGFCFTNLVRADDTDLFVMRGTDPDNPIKIPLDKLREFLAKHEAGVKESTSRDESVVKVVY